MKDLMSQPLDLGLRPKQRGYKGAGQEEVWESHHILPGV